LIIARRLYALSAIDAPASRGAAEALMSLVCGDGNGMSVMLTVEDEFVISEYLRLLLEQAGYDVVPTYNAGEAIAVLERRTDIHTIITDINMSPASSASYRSCSSAMRHTP
jgi:PleD family two-component response regulator